MEIKIADTFIGSGNKPFVITYERTVTSGSYTFYNNNSLSSGFEEKIGRAHV